MQGKETTIRYHVTSARMACIQITSKTNVNVDVEKREALWTLDGLQIGTTMEKNIKSFLKKLKVEL